MDPILTQSAVELAARIRRGELSARHATDAHIDRIEAVNPRLNAVVADRFAAARAEADAADRRLAEEGPERVPPLHGVPCTIKESFQLEGMPNTAGQRSRVGQAAREDATAVARWRAAGAIPLGVTNTSELCMWMETNNRVYGRTNNPYDPSRIVGGSSGGEGAIVGAGGSPFGLGADVGGSIRMPAFFNGVFGHKPTGGLVPNTGQYPDAEGDARRFLTTGPICRRGEDIWPLLHLLAGPDGIDAGCAEFDLGDPAGVDVGKLDVLVVPGNGRTKVDPRLVAAQRRAAGALAEAGATVTEARFDKLARSFDIWSSMLSMAESRNKFRSLMGYESGTPLLGELLKWAVRGSDHTLPAILLALVDDVTHWTPRRTARMVALGRALREELVDAIGENGVMLYPSYARPAPKHYHPLMPPFEWVYTAILNVMELPVTQVPLGLTDQRQPLGVQVAAVHGNDHLTVAVGQYLERRFGGWIPPWEVAGAEKREAA